MYPTFACYVSYGVFTAMQTCCCVLVDSEQGTSC